MRSLSRVQLRENAFTGTIPAAIGRLTSLRLLDLSKNWLRGVIPDELGALASLAVLRLDENALVGAVPASLGELGALTALHLEFNQLSGAVPVDALARLTALRKLGLHQNNFAESDQLDAHVALKKTMPHNCVVSVRLG